MNIDKSFSAFNTLIFKRREMFSLIKWTVRIDYVCDEDPTAVISENKEIYFNFRSYALQNIYPLLILKYTFYFSMLCVFYNCSYLLLFQIREWKSKYLINV